MRYTRNRRVKYAALATAVGSVGMLGSVGTAFADTTAGPIGSLDVVTASAGSIWVAGWTIDPDTSASTTVQIYVDGTYAASASADLERDDVGAAYASYGSLHGFELSVDGLSTGTHTVAAYGIDTTGENDNSFLGSKSITIGGGTFGFVDVVTQAPGNTLRLAGWVIDPDSSDSTIVHVYIDGVFAAALDADRMRDDVADAYPGYGAEHG
ncbi:MAG TPA: hypothetical protein VGQ20_14990, partial [Acidimicrobiales bacterium]|nr:hypothetical protein [Acidimicrobiales bacterium]